MNSQPDSIEFADALDRLSESTSSCAWLHLITHIQSHPQVLNVSSGNGETLLHLAAEQLHPTYCALLLVRGASVAALDDFHGETALHSLVQMRSGEEHAGGDLEAAAGAAEIPVREAEVVRVLVAGGADADACDSHSETPLMQACRFGRVSIVEALLAAPGDRKGWEKNGAVVVNGAESPLKIAVEYGCLNVVRALCRRDARPRVMVVSPERSSLREMANLFGFDQIAEIVDALDTVLEVGV